MRSAALWPSQLLYINKVTILAPAHYFPRPEMGYGEKWKKTGRMGTFFYVFVTAKREKKTRSTGEKCDWVTTATLQIIFVEESIEIYRIHEERR